LPARNELLRLGLSAVEHDRVADRIQNGGVVLQVADVVAHVAFQAEEVPEQQLEAKQASAGEAHAMMTTII
jgi:hypothetical protein